jgi:NAD(P)-dependent dehydrogenase (short-subunit alcohol dehydrogenase family)
VALSAMFLWALCGRNSGLGRLPGQPPEEIVAAAMFLASDDSSFVAGVELSVDGSMAQV